MGERGVVTINQGFVNVFYVPGTEGGLLVDAGVAGKEDGILQELAALGVNPEDIRCVLITHAHSDHYGGLADLKAATGAKVLASRTAAEFMREGASEPIVPQGILFKSIFSLAGGLAKISDRVKEMVDPEIDPVEADVPVDGEFDLAEFGVGGRVLSTPGHTLGSLSVYLDSGDLMIGDTFMALGRSISISVAQDRNLVKESMEQMLSLPVERVHLSHGSSCGPEEMRRLYDRQFGGT